ncbi:MAG: hypothetical protein OEU56_17270, partial [Rhodospirillales bacterium]|nr:hypothetical protein [Rhodospirillales bacterium]
MTPPIYRFPSPFRLSGQTGTALLAAVFAVVLAMLAAMPAVQAQETNLNSLLNRIERLQRDLNTLQRHVYRGETPPAAAAGAELS